VQEPNCLLGEGAVVVLFCFGCGDGARLDGGDQISDERSEGLEPTCGSSAAPPALSRFAILTAAARWRLLGATARCCEIFGILLVRRLRSFAAQTTLRSG
jgi:hypothetical protein